jgi:hypothetical protein
MERQFSSATGSACLSREPHAHRLSPPPSSWLLPGAFLYVSHFGLGERKPHVIARSPRDERQTPSPEPASWAHQACFAEPTDRFTLDR